MPSVKSVLIIGGGVAGIAAAVALSDRGFRVEIVEKRPLLGGRASSYLDPTTGERLDECQHGTMRCCTNLTDLLTRLGVQDQIRYHDTLHFLDGDGVRSVIQGSGLPAPLHTAPSFLLFRSLNLKDKIGIARGMMAMLRARPDPKHDTITVAEWYRQTGQTERAVKRFWDPILVSACNETSDRIAYSHALKIFRDGFLLHPTAFHFGVPRVPLGSLYNEPALAYLAKRGGCVRLRTIVEELDFATDGVSPRLTGVVLRDGTRLEADYYISALQFDLLLKLLPESVTANVPYWQNLHGLELAPICGVHLWFDRTLDCPEALAVLDRDTEWIFHKNLNFDKPEQAGEGSYLSIVISASHRLTGLPKEEILARVLADVRACLPDSREAVLVRSQVIRWPKATISPKPGADALRPSQISPIPNLLVAGEWTRTGWPSTMEGAARSGYLAAEALLAAEGRPESLLAPDLPRPALARLLASR
jgi:squalene-associated FAD-dependent desaturase